MIPVPSEDTVKLPAATSIGKPRATELTAAAAETRPPAATASRPTHTYTFMQVSNSIHKWYGTGKEFISILIRIP